MLTAKSFLNAIFPDRNKGKDVYYQGSRQMTNISRRYYEKELGAGIGPAPGMNEMFGYSEPLRRFIQREGFEPQANEIQNTMPSWMPGEDYYTNFKVGDPYIKVDQGFARLPGAGYAALHPELKDVNPEDYPDINKMAILADVAPYSREYNQVFPSCLTPKTTRTRGRRLASPLGFFSSAFLLRRAVQFRGNRGWHFCIRTPRGTCSPGLSLDTCRAHPPPIADKRAPRYRRSWQKLMFFLEDDLFRPT